MLSSIQDNAKACLFVGCKIRMSVPLMEVDGKTACAEMTTLQLATLFLEK